MLKEIVEEPAPATDATTEGTPETPAAAPATEGAPKKKRFIRTALKVDATYTSGYDQAKIDAFIAREAAITAQDTMLRETRDKRNELETYIYAMRNKLQDSLSAYATDVDKSSMMDKLNDAENWLYGDGFDETKSVYQMHLDALKSLGDPIQRREFEHTNRSEAAKAVSQGVEYFKKIALSTVRHPLLLLLFDDLMLLLLLLLTFSLSRRLACCRSVLLVLAHVEQ